jgi:putative tryptophan/tyrosine transport system substrate-binding protein
MIRRSLEPSAMADLNRRLSRHAAAFVDKILKGARSPAICRSEFSSKIEMVINLRTAKALGLEVPPSLLARADEVIE